MYYLGNCVYPGYDPKALQKSLALMFEAVQGEKEDRLFYEYLISIAPTQADKEIIASIRDDEIRHNLMFKNMYLYFTGQEVRDVTEEGFKKPASYVDGIQQALFGELKAVEKYREIRKGLPDRHHRDLVFEILTDELKHAAKYNFLYTENRTKGRVQSEPNTENTLDDWIGEEAQNWKLVEKAMGKPGVMKPDGVFYISLPRSDLKVTVKGMPIRTGLALGGWTAFKQVDDQAMVMGDLVLTENEIQPVMNQLFHQGIQVTALHNHLLDESPRIMYMHIEGHGNPVQLAKAIRSALELTKIPLNDELQDDSHVLSIDKQKLDNIFGHKGTVSDGIYHMSIPRVEKIMENGMEIPPAMGVSTTINFQPTKNGTAAITGDFVLTAEEVNPVARTLRKRGIEVTAIHNHMLTENPRLFFMHFWAKDDPIKLAKALREAIDKTHSM